MINKMWRSECVRNLAYTYMRIFMYTCTHTHFMNAVLTMDLMRMTFLMMFSGWILNTLMERGERERERERERFDCSNFLPCRYFTWDGAKFPDSVEMQNKLAAKGRKMVTIIDPHIKRDGNYHIHKVKWKLRIYIYFSIVKLKFSTNTSASSIGHSQF